MYQIRWTLVTWAVLGCTSAFSAEIKASKVITDLSKISVEDQIWSHAPEESISLMAQPMALPRPKSTQTAKVQIRAIHDGQWIAFRLRWKSVSKNESGKIGEFSDAVAIQFPIKEGPPPPVFMGAKDQPVHIFHWRAQYQRDFEKGKPEMKDLYPHMSPDMYPMEFKDPGNLKNLSEEHREVYSPGKAAGNPQSYVKSSPVDEILAEGFGSSSVIENHRSMGKALWSKGEWLVVITRPLKLEAGSVLEPGKNNFMAFAVWQGAQQEVGSRKSVTMSWVPLHLGQ